MKTVNLNQILSKIALKEFSNSIAKNVFIKILTDFYFLEQLVTIFALRLINLKI